MRPSQARFKTDKLVASGEIEAQDWCEYCGSSVNVVKHHNNYYDPKDITWLCRICHGRWHEENGHAKNWISEKNGRIPILIRVSGKTKDKIQHIAQKEDCTISYLLRYEIARLIDKWESENGKIKEQ
jgi:hypothetical protein